MMNTIKGTQSFHDVRKGETSNIDGLIFPVQSLNFLTEKNDLERKVEEGKLIDELIGLEVGQIGDEEVDKA